MSARIPPRRSSHILNLRGEAPTKRPRPQPHIAPRPGIGLDIMRRPREVARQVAERAITERPRVVTPHRRLSRSKASNTRSSPAQPSAPPIRAPSASGSFSPTPSACSSPAAPAASPLASPSSFSSPSRSSRPSTKPASPKTLPSILTSYWSLAQFRPSLSYVKKTHKALKPLYTKQQ
jgi:hypothetical protein